VVDAVPGKPIKKVLAWNTSLSIVPGSPSALGRVSAAAMGGSAVTQRARQLREVQV
jgi:hypothetical protein